MSRAGDYFNHRKSKFLTFIFEKIRNNPVRVGVNPLPKDENVEKEETIMKKLGPEIITAPEKFEAKRLVLAERVWKEMTENNSRECRNCHAYEHMNFAKQDARAREKMEEAKAKNTPCIECHKGIAHKKPLVPRDD